MLRIEFSEDADGLIKAHRRTVTRALKAALKAEGFKRRARVSVLLTDNEGIRALNRDFRAVDKATDVLSFPSGELDGPSPVFLGDVALSVERAAAQAAEIGQSVEREVAFLCVHSMLHLLGYDHMNEADEVVMRERQRIIMKSIF